MLTELERIKTKLELEIRHSTWVSWIGKEVVKKSKKPFKSKLIVNTVKGFEIDETRKPFRPVFTFVEDDSKVYCKKINLKSNITPNIKWQE